MTVRRSKKSPTNSGNASGITDAEWHKSLATGNMLLAPAWQSTTAPRTCAYNKKMNFIAFIAT